MNIVISANTSWYLYNFRKNTILALLNQGYQVTAIAPRDEYSEKLRQLGANYKDIYIDQGGMNPLNDIKTFLAFRKLYSSKQYDIALNFTPKNNIYSTMAAKLYGMKVINNIAGLGTIFIKTNLTAKIAKALYKISQRKADKIFFQNDDDRNLFLSNHIASPDITDRLPGSGVDLSRFTVQKAEDDGKTRFLLIARMLYEKGIEHYVDAARYLTRKYGQQVEISARISRS